MSKPIDPQAAMQQIWELAPRYAKAKSERIYLEEYRKSKKALLMKTSAQNSAVMQERDAYADPEYIAVLAGLRAAVEAEETLRWRMVASEAAVEIWRTQCANDRSIDKAAR